VARERIAEGDAAIAAILGVPGDGLPASVVSTKVV